MYITGDRRRTALSIAKIGLTTSVSNYMDAGSKCRVVLVDTTHSFCIVTDGRACDKNIDT